MVLLGEPATRRRCWKVQTHIATPGAVSLSAYPGLSWGLPALFNSSTVFTDVYGRWSLLSLLSEFLLCVISLPESDRMDGYIALLWYFSKNCLHWPSVRRSRFLLRCLDIAYVLPLEHKIQNVSLFLAGVVFLFAIRCDSLTPCHPFFLW